MKLSDFLQSNQALQNSLKLVLDTATEENYQDMLNDALEPFGPELKEALGGLTMG